MNPISKDMMWEQILNNTDSIFSVFTIKGEYCGSIELQQPDSNTPEIGEQDLKEFKELFEENIDGVVYRYRLNPNIFYDKSIFKYVYQ